MTTSDSIEDTHDWRYVPVSVFEAARRVNWTDQNTQGRWGGGGERKRSATSQENKQKIDKPDGKGGGLYIYSDNRNKHESKFSDPPSTLRERKSSGVRRKSRKVQ